MARTDYDTQFPGWRDQYAAIPTGAAGDDPATDFLRQRERSAVARARQPVLLAAQRIGLANTRVLQLTDHLAEARDRLLNRPSWAQVDDIRSLEMRVMKLEDQLHDERRQLFADLSPLLEKAADASIESMRASWLNELLRLTGGEGA